MSKKFQAVFLLLAFGIITASSGGPILDTNASNATLPDAQINLGVPVSPIGYGAVCDGVTNDTAAMLAVLAANKSVILPPGKVCVASELSVATNQLFNLNGSVLQAAPGVTSKVIEATGYSPHIFNGQIQDPNGFTVNSTTLNGAAAAGATTFVVTSAAGFSTGKLLTFTLSSGLRVVTKIAGVSGTTITPLDPVPASATSAAVAAGGTVCSVGDKLTIQGGDGAPAVVQVVTLTGDAAATVTVVTPGQYTTAPAPVAATVPSTAGHCLGTTITLTTLGAPNGGTVAASIPLLLLDKTVYATVENMRFSSGVPLPIKIAGSGSGIPPSYITANSTLRNIYADSITEVGIFLDVDASNVTYDNVTMYGLNGYGGAVGFYNEARSNVSATGGHVFNNVQLLGFQTGFLLRGAENNLFTSTVSDTQLYYAWLISGAVDNLWGGTNWAAYTGSGGRLGLGMVFIDTSINNVLGGTVRFNHNASDLYLASNSPIQASLGALGPSTIISGGGIITTPMGMGSDSLAVVGANYTGSVRTTNTGADKVMKTGAWLTNYNIISLNNDITSTTPQGIAGGKVSDQGTYLLSPSAVTLRINGVNVASYVPTYTQMGFTTPLHIASGQTTPPALTSCGTGSPAIVGTDTAGTVTLGTAATSCVITFNVVYAAAPHCTVTWQATPLLSQSYAISNAAITLTQTSASGNVVNYMCMARSGG